jgi:Flp pilus assembly pilin Flp
LALKGGEKMLRLIKGFLKDEDGASLVEWVLIIAIVVAIALIFKNAIITFVKNILAGITGKEGEFNDPSKIDAE